MKNLNYKKIVARIIPSLVVLSIFALPMLGVLSVQAQNVNTLQTVPTSENPTQTGFRIVTCDGPTLPTQALKDAAQAQIDHTYIPCDFNGAMIQIQHLINLAMVLGVFAAIVLFTYAGFLMLTGKEDDRKKAKDIFPKVGIGFIIMLTAWFVVYQILSWLTGSSIFTKLLGNP